MSTAKTKPRTAADLWSLLARSGLHEPAHVAALQGAFAASSADGKQEAAAAAQWLVSRKQLTGWQARRLLRGESGPFMIGDYRLLERIESPSGAILLRATHVPSARTVVIAMLDRERCREVEAWTAIVRRTAIAHQMADPIFSKTWALEQTDGNRIIVCEDVAGPTLFAEVSKQGGLPVKEAGWITLALARAVAEHQRSAGVHGAISLESLRRDPQTGGVRLLQYPLVGDPHASPPRVPLERPEAISLMGTQTAFLAPECILSGGNLDETSDVYAIGCVLAALVTGNVPGWKGTAEATLASIAMSGFEPPAPPQVPVEVGTLIGYLSARDPAQRYATAADAASAIAACFGFPAMSAAETPSPEVGPFAATATPEPSGVPSFATGTAAAQAGAGVAGPSGDATRRARRRAGIFRAAVAALAAALLVGVTTFAFLGREKDRRRDGRTSVAKRTDRMTTPRAVATSDEDEEEGDEEEEAAMTGEGDDESIGVSVDAVADDARPAAAPPKVVRVTDDGVLWDAPTHAGPPSLDYLPPGSQVMLLVRPADTLATEEGVRFLKALGPPAEAAVRDAAALCGREPQGIERILAGWQVDAKGAAIAAFAIELAEPIDAGNPPSAWKSMKVETVQAGTVGEETVYRGPKFSLAVPAARGGRLLVAAPPDLLTIMLETGGAPLLTPDMQRLTEHLDASRHVVVVGSPAFLENHGRDMLSGPLGRLAEPVARFFGPGVHAAALSLHFGAISSYAELIAVPPRDLPAPALAESLAKGVVSLPDSVEGYIASLDLHPYGRKLVNRLPAMVRILEANLRRGSEDGVAVVNCHLPPTAPHNIALASEIALEQRPGASLAANGGNDTPKTAAEALQKKISLSFPRDSLDRTIQTISEEIGLPMEILGGDLELKGITQNQSFGLDERDQTVDAILRTILMKANPDGHLVYVIRRKNGVESIVISTRDACASRGEPIPEVFKKP